MPKSSSNKSVGGRNRDHRKIGQELDLFTSSEIVGSGLPLFTPKGAVLRRELINFVEGLEREAGYKEVWIPHITKPELYKVSGHLDKFGEDLFYVKGEESKFILKPMNCPHHIQIYKSRVRSYRDLPIRYFETTTVYRDEQSGEIGGLTRVRSITIDDGHAFVREDQLEKEFEINLKIQEALAKTVKVKDYRIQLSLRDEKNKKAYLGDDETWLKAQEVMESVLKKKKIKYTKVEGEAAFYGPKMDFMAKDSIGREWQLSTIQLDLNMPKRFRMEYIDKDGSPKTPMMIHRAFMGSVERFIAFVIEHYAGAFPTWLAPVQVQVLPVSQKQVTEAKKVFKALEGAGIRAELTQSDETLGKRIREGEVQKIPYILVIGEKEAKIGSVAVRKRGRKDIKTQKLTRFVEDIQAEISKRK
jgi:threonyl-tRNA synthetase